MCESYDNRAMITFTFYILTAVEEQYTQGNSDVILFHIYAS